MKKCIILGSKGFIGQHIDWYLKNMGVVSDCYDIQPESGEEHYYQVDLTDKNSLKNINFNVDYVFLFAGLTGTKAGFMEYERYVRINEVVLLNVLDTIRCSPYRPKIIFPSTRLVYKGAEIPLTENAEKDSKTIYAVNKLACEGYLKAYSQSFDIPYTIFRICVPYGNLINNNYSFGTIGFFIKMGEQKKDITLYGGGHLKRTFTHMEDLCKQIINASFLNQSDCQTYNVGGETFSLREVAELMASKYGVNIVDVPWPDEDLRIESGSTFFDSNKIEQLLGGYDYRSLTNSLNV